MYLPTVESLSFYQTNTVLLFLRLSQKTRGGVKKSGTYVNRASWRENKLIQCLSALYMHYSYEAIAGNSKLHYVEITTIGDHHSLLWLTKIRRLLSIGH